MTLSEWMTQTGTTQSVLARSLKTTRDTVRRWLDGGCLPSKRMLLRLAKVTGGNVCEADFALDVHPTVSTLEDVMARTTPR